MALYLERDLGPDQLRRELTDPEFGFWLAFQSELPVGYLKMRWHHREDSISGRDPAELCRLYALRRTHGTGVGSELLQLAFRESLQRGHDVIWLGVWEKNPRARAFYAKWGFQECGSHPFLFGSDLQTDLLMQRPLL